MKTKLILAVLFLSLTTGTAFAQDVPTSVWEESGCISSDGIPTLRCIPVVLQNLINFMMAFASVVCVGIIIFAGVKFVTSEGDPEKIATARKTVLYGLGGFVLILMSFLIMNILGVFTGVSRLSPTSP